MLEEVADSPDGHIDIVFGDKVPEVHLGAGLRHSDHRLNVSAEEKELFQLRKSKF